jgi:hypothetical protein
MNTVTNGYWIASSTDLRALGLRVPAYARPAGPVRELANRRRNARPVRESLAPYRNWPGIAHYDDAIYHGRSGSTSSFLQ